MRKSRFDVDLLCMKKKNFRRLHAFCYPHHPVSLSLSPSLPFSLSISPNLSLSLSLSLSVTGIRKSRQQQGHIGDERGRGLCLVVARASLSPSSSPRVTARGASWTRAKEFRASDRCRARSTRTRDTTLLTARVRSADAETPATRLSASVHTR